MSALARIRKTALQHEQERQYDKALALYARLLDGAEAGDEEVDVALFNRAGDLALRLGDTPRALGYFERALDLYAAGGLLNNAVALGVKILRHAPTHLSAHYTLGVLYGRKGFAGDARHHLLTYAVQMQRAGRPDEAARVLAEVAAACLDAGERRAALDAYAALGGDAAQAAVLSAAPPSGAATAAAAPVAPPPAAAPASVTWGAVDFELPDAATPPAAAPKPASTTGEFVLPSLLDAFAPGDDALGEAPTAGRGTPAAAGTSAPASAALPGPEDAPGAWDALGIAPIPAAAADRPVVVVEPLDFDLPPADADAGAAAPALTFLDPAAGAPRWADALGDEPPALRLGELLRLDAGAADRASADRAPADRAPADLLLGARADWDVAAPRAPLADLPATPLAPWTPEPPTVPDPALADAYDAALDLPLVPRVAPGVPAPRTPSLADAPPAASAAAADDLLDLGAWLRDTAEPTTTRLTTANVPQTGDEQADFDATLRTFTAGVTRMVDHADWDSHYDLGVAFREMGLVDEAIVQFQRAAGAPGRPLRALEALAQCFLDVGQPEVALSTLEGPAADAAATGTGDASLVGVHYLMGSAAQALGRPDAARRWLVRVVATDVRFRDAAQRLAALPPPNPVR